MSKHVGVAAARRRALPAGFVLLAVSVATGVDGRVSAATQPPTFATTDHPLIGNTHIVADFNGDGSLDLAGTGLPRVGPFEQRRRGVRAER